jgi:hypothetical protein
MAKFERKTLKKTVETAEEQEIALARLRAGEQKNSIPPSVSTILEDSKSIKTPLKTEKKVEKPAMMNYKEKYPKESQRVNLDLPQDLYDAVQEQIRKNGQTMKGFFMVAAWEYIQNKQQ